MKDYRMNYFESFVYVLFNIFLGILMFVLFAGAMIGAAALLHIIAIYTSVWVAVAVAFLISVAIIAYFVYQNEQTRNYTEW